MSLEIDGALRALLESGVAVVIGTRGRELEPEVARGWGVRVLPDGGVLVCVGLPSAERTLANLADNGRVALTCVRPTDYRQVQLKGRVVATSAASDEDQACVAAHRAAFTREVAHVGIREQDCHLFWSHDEPGALVSLRLLVEEAYDQTPGPRAGQPL